MFTWGESDNLLIIRSSINITYLKVSHLIVTQLIIWNIILIRKTVNCQSKGSSKLLDWPGERERVSGVIIEKRLKRIKQKI